MSDKKISELTLGTPAEDDVIPFTDVSGGVTLKALKSALKGDTGDTGVAGADGDDSYVYIAYASADDGTGFTLTFNSALDYIAIKTTTTAIANPQASNFTGLWKNYKGVAGAQGIQGIQGIQGLTGNNGTNGTSFIWEGAYSAGTTYAVNDAVSYSGSSYICKLESTGNVPTNSTYWDLLALKGTDGTGAGDMLLGTAQTVTAAKTFNAGTLKVGEDVAVTATATELNFIDGVTSAIQTQLNAKASLVSPSFTTPNLGTPSAGTLSSCSGLPVSGITASTSTALGVGSIELGHASDTTLSRVAAGILAVEGQVLNGWTTTATSAGTTAMTIASTPIQFWTGTTTQTITLPTTGVVIGQQYTITNRGTSNAAVLTVQSSGANEVFIIGYGCSVIFTALQATPTTAAHWSANKWGSKNIKTATSYTTDTGTSLNCDYYDTFIVTAQAGALKFNNPTGTPRDGQTMWLAVTGTAARALTYDTQYEASAGVALPSTTVTTARLDIGFVWRADTSKWHSVASA